MDPYAGMAQRYDLFHGDIQAHDADETAFFAWLVRSYRLQTVLDCACGTGRHLHLLHALGCEVTGSDLSPAMLAQARKNLGRVGRSVPLCEADYGNLPQHFDCRFDAVLCLSSSFLHMPDQEKALLALQSMRAVLRPGGVLVMTQGTSDYQWQQKPRFIVAVDNASVTRLFVIDYQGEGARYNIVDVLHGQEDSLQVWSVDYPRVWLQDDYQRLLPQAGFTSQSYYASWDRRPYAQDRPGRLIVIGQTA